MVVNLKPSAVVQLLKKGKHAPIYFLQGLEPFYIDEIVAQVESMLPLEERKLNLIVMHGKSVTIQKIVNQIKSVAMLGSKKIVIVKNAQEVEDMHQKSGQATLMNYVKNPCPENLLVLAYKGKVLPSSSKLGKLLVQKKYLVTSPKVYERDLVGWIQSYVASLGYRITPDAAMTLEALVGPQLSFLAKELKKIMISQASEEDITRDTVSHYVGMHKEVNNFALQNALCYKNKAKAMQIVHHLSQNSKQYPILPLLSLLTTFFTKVLQLYASSGETPNVLASKLKIHPYFMKDYLGAKKCYAASEVANSLYWLHEADLQVKGIGSGAISEGAILEELIAKILLE